MNAAVRGMIAPARTSGAKMGKPVSIFEIVPGKERNDYKHKIFWAKTTAKSVEQYNSVVVIYKKPCLRRWLEFNSGKIPKGLEYETIYSPVCVCRHPQRYWTLLKDGEPYACFTNCVECWLLVLSGESFAHNTKWAMLYTDRSGR